MNVDAGRRLTAAAYLVAGMLVAIPLLDTTLAVLPAHTGQASWRFGALGLYGQAVMTPMLGLLMACAVATLAGHLRLLRGLAVACGLSAVLCALAIGLLAWDLIHLQVQVAPEARTSFDVAAAVALGKLSVGALGGGLLFGGGWSAAGRLEKAGSRSPERGERSRMVVRPQGT